jgi:hypothetical protein
VIVNYLDIGWMFFTVGPLETYAVLIVDPNAVLALTISAQCFQSVSSHRAKRVKTDGRIQLVEFRLCLEREAGESFDKLTLRESLRIPVTILGWYILSRTSPVGVAYRIPVCGIIVRDDCHCGAEIG